MNTYIVVYVAHKQHATLQELCFLLPLMSALECPTYNMQANRKKNKEDECEDENWATSLWTIKITTPRIPAAFKSETHKKLKHDSYLVRHGTWIPPFPNLMSRHLNTHQDN